MLNSAEHDILTAHYNLNAEQKHIFLAFILAGVLFIMLRNVKMSKIIDILTFMSKINFMLSWVEHEKVL